MKCLFVFVIICLLMPIVTFAASASNPPPRQIDFNQVVKNIETGEVYHDLTLPDGKPDLKSKAVTFGLIAARALLLSLPGDDKDKPEDKAHRFFLAEELVHGGVHSLSADDTKMLVDRISKSFGTPISVPVTLALDPTLEPKK